MSARVWRRVADSTAFTVIQPEAARERPRSMAAKPMIDDPVFQMRLSDIEMELMALEYTELRVSLPLWLQAECRGRSHRC